MEGAVEQRDLTEGSSSAAQMFPAELDLFQIPSLATAYTAENYVDYRPSSAISSNNPLEYVIPASISQYTDLKGSRHHVRFRIVKEDGSETNPTDDFMVGPCNWPAVTMFQQFQLYLNQVLVSPSGGQHHGYRAIIEALLDRHRFEKDIALQAGLYRKDTAGHMEDLDANSTGFSWRWQYTAASRKVWVSAPLITDLSQQERLILNSVDIVMKFWPAQADFALMSDDPEDRYRIEILDAFIRLKRKTPQPAVSLAVDKALSISPALYPNLRTEVRMFLVPRGQFQINYEGLFEGNVPSVMCVTFVKASAAVGRFSQNPFNFIPSDLQELSVQLDDQASSEPVMRFRFDAAGSPLKSDYLDAFDSLYRQSPESDSDGTEEASSYCSITRAEFATGYCLLLFRFTSSATQKWLPSQSRANVKLRGSFARAPEENLQMIVYSRFPSLISIDKTRRVSY